MDVSLCHSWGRSPGRLSSGLQGSPWKGHSSRVLCGARGPASVRCHCYWVSSQVVTARTRHRSVSSRRSLAGLPLQGGAVSCPRSSIKSVLVNKAALGVAGSHLLLPLFYFDARFFQLGGPLRLVSAFSVGTHVCEHVLPGSPAPRPCRCLHPHCYQGDSRSQRPPHVCCWRSPPPRQPYVAGILRFPFCAAPLSAPAGTLTPLDSLPADSNH